MIKPTRRTRPAKAVIAAREAIAANPTAKRRARPTAEQREQEAIAARKARDLAFIRNPEDWPRWPVLPLKLRDGDVFDKNFAALLFASGTPVIYFANLFDLPTGERGEGKTWANVLSVFELRIYPSFEALVEEYTVD